MELDSSDAIQALDRRQWERYRQELEKLGGLPASPDQPFPRDAGCLASPGGSE
jgi:hypothetical protein